jgi:hypothetical protein
MYVVVFYLLLILLISNHYRLDVSLFKKIQDYEEKTLSGSKQEARQVFLNHLEALCFLPLVTLLHANPKLNTYLIPLGLGFVSGQFCLAL